MKQYLENFPERAYNSVLIHLMMEDNREGRINQTTQLDFAYMFFHISHMFVLVFEICNHDLPFI
jgi:hypothetical protein